jgi:hypothetical protein
MIFFSKFFQLQLALEFTQPLTEMTKVRPVRKADKLTAICEPIV